MTLETLLQAASGSKLPERPSRLAAGLETEEQAAWHAFLFLPPWNSPQQEPTQMPPCAFWLRVLGHNPAWEASGQEEGLEARGRS